MPEKMDLAAYQQLVESKDWRPRSVVWELTLACDLRCEHCGSRAGHVRTDELDLDECLGVVDELDSLGAELVSLSGGEPTLKKGWDQIAKALSDRGIYTNMVTNGAYKTLERAQDIAQRAKAAGMCNVGVSVDGTREIHDKIRGDGNYDLTMRAIEQFCLAGIKVAMMTTVNKTNLPHLEAIRQIAIDSGATMLRLQLSKPMGSMDDHRDNVIEPDQLLGLLPLLARLKKMGEIKIAVGDSIGYYGPHDAVLRGLNWRGNKQVWRGCQAGMNALGIQANGDVKGCLSLQAMAGENDPFVEGNIRDSSLAAIWRKPGSFAFNREFSADSLTGKCGKCNKAKQCRGGARCVSSANLGHMGEDPFCWWGVSGNYLDRPSPIKTAAAAAGLAVLLSTGMVACEYGIEPDPDAVTKSDAVDDSVDDSTAAEYGVIPDMVDNDATATPDYGVMPDMVLEYGVTPDTIDDSLQMEYGVIPDATDDAVSTDYGVLPDADAEDSMSTDYGVPQG